MVSGLIDEHPADTSAELQVRPLPPQPISVPVSPSRRSRHWLVLAALVAGLALGALFGGSSDPILPEPESLLNKPLAPEAQAAGLADSVADFEDALLAVAPNGVGAMQMYMWPPTGPLQPSAVPASWTAITLDDGPFTDFAAFDVSGQQVALATPVAREGTPLQAGRLGAVVPVATGVTSYVWHHSAPRHLIYTVVDQDGTWIEVMRGSPRQVERLVPVDPGSKVVAWADWGYALSSAGRLTLVGENSRIEVTGRVLAGSDSELLVEVPGAVVWIDPTTGEERRTEITPGVVRATIAPSGDLLAIAHVDNFAVIRGDVVTFRENWPHVERLAWSLDEGFVLFSDRTDVMVLDLAREQITPLGLSRAVAVATRSSAISSQ